MDIAGRKPDQRVAGLGDRHPRPAGPARATGRPSCPAASSSGSPAPGRWPAGRRSSSATSRPATWTPARPARCSASCATRSTKLGQTVVIVTHDPRAASYADRVVFLADGRDRRRDAFAHRRLGPGPDEEPRGRGGMTATLEGTRTPAAAMRRVSLRNLAAHKVRLALTVLSVVLGHRLRHRLLRLHRHPRPPSTASSPTSPRASTSRSPAPTSAAAASRSTTSPPSRRSPGRGAVRPADPEPDRAARRRRQGGQERRRAERRHRLLPRSVRGSRSRSSPARAAAPDRSR